MQKCTKMNKNNGDERKRKWIVTGEFLFPLLVDKASIYYISEHFKFYFITDV